MPDAGMRASLEEASIATHSIAVCTARLEHQAKACGLCVPFSRGPQCRTTCNDILPAQCLPSILTRQSCTLQPLLWGCKVQTAQRLQPNACANLWCASGNRHTRARFSCCVWTQTISDTRCQYSACDRPQPSDSYTSTRAGTWRGGMHPTLLCDVSFRTCQQHPSRVTRPLFMLSDTFALPEHVSPRPTAIFEALPPVGGPRHSCKPPRQRDTIKHTLTEVSSSPAVTKQPTRQIRPAIQAEPSFVDTHAQPAPNSHEHDDRRQRRAQKVDSWAPQVQSGT